MQDLEAITAYWESHSQAKADAVLDEVLAKVIRLEDFPAMGALEPHLARQRPAGGYRFLLVRTYKIIYRAEQTVIWIDRIVNARQNPAGYMPRK